MRNRTTWRWFAAWIYVGLLTAMIVFLFVPHLHYVAAAIWGILVIPIAIAELVYSYGDIVSGKRRSGPD